MSYACGKRYYVCVTCMLWCSDTESVPLLVSNIHDIILVRTQYVLVCTGLYSYSIPVPVCARYVPVRTGSEPVRTKYPIPVMRLTIPDDSSPAGPMPGTGETGWSSAAGRRRAGRSVPTGKNKRSSRVSRPFGTRSITGRTI